MTTSSAPSGRRTALTRAALAVIAVLAFVMFSYSIPYYFTVDNLINLLNEVALAGIVAMPATFLIMSGQVDLSVGATAAFVGIVLAATAPESGPLTAVLLAVGTGLLIGLVNGLLVTAGGVPSIAATFASMALVRGLAYLVPSGLALARPFVDGDAAHRSGRRFHAASMCRCPRSQTPGRDPSGHRVPEPLRLIEELAISGLAGRGTPRHRSGDSRQGPFHDLGRLPRRCWRRCRCCGRSCHN